MFLFPEESIVFCSDVNVYDLGCTRNLVLMITYANYGRTAPYTEVCSEHTGSKENTNCISGSDIVQSACSGKQQCTLHKSNFTDVCQDTTKYLDVHYQCITPSAGMCIDSYG